MDTGHRKIELQSQEDFTYLVDNARRAAAENINTAFPPIEGAEHQEDQLRIGIEELVNDYIARTYALAAPNLSINGLPVPESLLPKKTGADSSAASGPKRRKTRKGAAAAQADEENEEVVYEPFDARLRDRIPDLLREEEDLLREIAALKRRVPATAAARVADTVRTGVAADEAALTAARERVAGPGAIERGMKGRKRLLDLGVAGDGAGAGSAKAATQGVLLRPEEVEQAYEAAVDGLGRLKRDMPSTVARMERARAVGGYVIAGR